MKKVNVLAIYSESNHEYRRCDPTAVVRSDDWLDLSYFSACGRCSIKDQKVNEHLENRFRHEGKWMFWRFMLNQTMNRDFVIQLQWYTVLTDWTWTFAHLRNMLCQGPEGSSAPGKPVSPWRKVNVLAIYSVSNHEYRRCDPTAVVRSDDWLDLNYFSACGRCSIKDQKVNEHLENRFRHEGKWMFWRFMLNQTMNTDFLIQLQWYTVLTD